MTSPHVNAARENGNVDAGRLRGGTGGGTRDALDKNYKN